MEAKIERRHFVSEIREVDKAIVKAVHTLGYDQPADVTIRKTLGLYVHFLNVETMSLFDSKRKECAIAS